MTLVAACLVTAAAPRTFDRLQGLILERSIDSVLHRVGGLSFAALHLGSRTLTLKHVAISSPGMQVLVGRLVAPVPSRLRPALVGSAAAATSGLTLDDVRISIGKTLIVIPHMEAKGSPLSAEDFARIFDAASSESLESRLSRLTAKSVTAPEVTVSRPTERSSDATGALVFRDVDLTDVEAGRVGGFAVRGMRLVASKTKPDAMATTGPVTAARLDLPLAWKIATGTRPDAAAMLQPVVGSIAIQDIALKTPEGDVRLASLRSDGLRGRPLLTSFSEIATMDKTPEADRGAADRQRLTAAWADGAASFSLDHAEAQEFGFATTGADAVSVSLGRLVLDGLEAGRLRLLAADRFAMTTKPANLTLAHAALEGYDQSLLLDAFEQQALSSDPNLVKDRFGKIVPTFSHFALAALHIDAEADGLKGNMQKGTRTIGDIPVLDAKYNKDVDGTSTGTVHAELLYEVGRDVVDPSLLDMFQAGFSHFDVSFDNTVRWDIKTQIASIERFSVAARDLASVSLGARFLHMSPDLFDTAQGAEPAMHAARKVEVESIKVDVVDAGLAAKAWALAAQGAGVSVPLLKAEAKGQAEVAVLQALGDRPAAHTISKAVSAFIDDPKTFMLSVKAPAGLTIETIANSDGSRDLLDLLDIEARANQ